MSKISMRHMPRKVAYIFLALMLLALLTTGGVRAPAAWSADITVDTLVDEDDGNFSAGDYSLREAILNAGSGQTIDFSVTGNISLTLGDLDITSNLIITGPGPASLTVSGGGLSRVFQVHTGIDVEISNLTIANGSADYGGGIHNRGDLTLDNCNFEENYAESSGGGIRNYEGNVTLSSCTFDKNDAKWGAGLSNRKSTATLTDCSFTDNTAESNGGAIQNRQGTLTLDQCTLTSNGVSDGYGGAISNHEATLTLDGCTFTGNEATWGGAIDSYSVRENYVTVATIKKCIFTGNKAEWGGALRNMWKDFSESSGKTPDSAKMSKAIGQEGVDNAYTAYGTNASGSSTAVIEKCSFSDNDALSEGGAILNVGVVVTGAQTALNVTAGDGSGSPGMATVILEECTISGNTAEDGGGIYNTEMALLRMRNSTLSGNVASDYGGGLLNILGASSKVDSSTICGNAASSDDGGGILNDEAQVEVRNSIIANNTAGDEGPDYWGEMNSRGYNLLESSADCTVIGIVTGNIYGDDPMLETLQDNGGDTMTCALQEDSPAIDSGSCTDMDGAAVDSDQRGVSRPQNGICDIGAFELAAVTPQPQAPGDGGGGGCGISTAGLPLLLLIVLPLLYLVRRR